MGLICSHCGSIEVVGHGSSMATTQVVRSGRLVEESFKISRVICKACGRTGSSKDPALLLAEATVREHLVRLVFSHGQAEASRLSGCPRSTLQRHLKAWSDAREDDVRNAEPALLLIDTVTLRGADRPLVIDLDRETVVELLPGTQELPGWLTQSGRAPAVRVCIPINSEIRAAIIECLPRANILIAPESARRRLLVEGALSLRSLRRHPSLLGSNGLPLQGEFSAAVLSVQPDTTGWCRAAASLAGAVRVGLAILNARSADEARSLLPEFEIASSGSESRRICQFVKTWWFAIMSGIEHRYVDRVAEMASRIRRDLAAKRPVLGFADARAFAVLDGFERRAESPLGWAGRAPAQVSRGRPLAGLMKSLGSR